jgi:hypothetical protein
MLTKTKIALAAALILGTASATWANDSGENHQDNDRSVVSASAGAAKAYGFAVSPKQTHRAAHGWSNDR